MKTVNKDLNPDKHKYNLKNFPEMKYKVLSDSWLNACLIDVNQSNRTKNKAKRIVKTFKINGICDVGYIANVIGANSPDSIEKNVNK